VCPAWLLTASDWFVGCTVDATWQSGAAAAPVLKRRKRAARIAPSHLAFKPFNDIPKD